MAFAKTIQGTKHAGIDSLALCFMFFLLLFLYGALAFFFCGLVIPLIYIFDDALLHIFELGKYGVLIIAFLLTYRMFTVNSGGSVQGLISNDVLRYWGFLNSGPRYECCFAALKSAITWFTLTLVTFGENEFENLKHIR